MNVIWKILIDLAHNEVIKSIPDGIFNPNEFFFAMNSGIDILDDYKSLKQYDIILFGFPQPRTRKEPLFQPEELIALKAYVKSGGNILLTTGKRGDFGQKKSQGSLRTLYHITGVKQFGNGVLFNRVSERHLYSKMNLAFDSFPNHPIFKDFVNEEDELFLGPSTPLIMAKSTPGKPVLLSLSHTEYHPFKKTENLSADRLPLLVTHEYGMGRVITTGFSDFLQEIPYSGIQEKNSQKLLKGMFSWLLRNEIYE